MEVKSNGSGDTQWRQLEHNEKAGYWRVCEVFPSIIVNEIPRDPHDILCYPCVMEFADVKNEGVMCIKVGGR